MSHARMSIIPSLAKRATVPGLAKKATRTVAAPERTRAIIFPVLKCPNRLIPTTAPCRLWWMLWASRLASKSSLTRRFGSDQAFCRLQVAALARKRKPEEQTVAQATELEHLRTRLANRIRAWTRRQAVQMASAVQRVQQLQQQQQVEYRGRSADLPPEELLIVLPSSFGEAERELLLLTELADIEYQLRMGSATDALRDMRHELRLLTFQRQTTAKYTNSQTYTSRNQSILATIRGRLEGAVARYRLDRIALLALGVKPGLVRELKKDDVKELQEWAFDTPLQHGQKKRKVPWIWLTEGIAEECQDPAVGLESEKLNFNLRSPCSHGTHSYSCGVHAGRGAVPTLDRGAPPAGRGDAAGIGVLRLYGSSLAGPCCHG